MIHVLSDKQLNMDVGVYFVGFFWYSVSWGSDSAFLTLSVLLNSGSSGRSLRSVKPGVPLKEVLLLCSWSIYFSSILF